LRIFPIGKAVCLIEPAPSAVRMFGQFAQVWVKYMDAEPKALILPPIETLLDALHGEFPCPG